MNFSEEIFRSPQNSLEDLLKSVHEPKLHTLKRAHMRGWGLNG